jgi:subtilisin family serine protease
MVPRLYDFRRIPVRQSLLLVPLLAGVLAGAEAVPWDKGDPDTDHVEGTRTEKAYAQLKLKAPPQPVIVAVLDSGVDIAHEDLKDRIWVNAKEKAGRIGTDDDKNGYVDDLNGWNFLGSKDGKRQVDHGTLEVTREYGRLLAAMGAGPLAPADEAYFARVEKMYFTRRTEALQQFVGAAAMGLQYDQTMGELRKLGLRETTPQAVAAFARTNPKARAGAAMVERMAAQGLTGDKLSRGVRELSAGVIYHYDLRLDESATIGDDPAKLDEVGYGNGGVAVEEAYHGTHVAGIIGAVRGNKLGIDGQCEWVRIMPVVAVPDGDERDKDVANGIRYAVDNGAKIINGSFGKPLSPQVAAVEAAMRYAESKGVLIVHAAGNDSADTDGGDNFPSPVARGGGKPHRYANWIEVGATTRTSGQGLVAEFSNYGHDTVDLFAPGDGIRSTIPGNGYTEEQGTSMAAPEVAGVAALVWSQYPRLTAAELRAVLLVTARGYPDVQVRKPGCQELVHLADLCLSGGIVDAYAALTYLEASKGRVKPEDLKTVQEWTARAEAPRAPKPDGDAKPDGEAKPEPAPGDAKKTEEPTP